VAKVKNPGRRPEFEPSRRGGVYRQITPGIMERRVGKADGILIIISDQAS
jgi:hypothetical protein